ncbi:hypothetical protein CKA34_21165 (plasmid) [Rhizobium sp. 11515TR]|nr:hypothetical protein CKA34_21165 [Rhizobium sp. 11515TR]
MQPSPIPPSVKTLAECEFDLYYFDEHGDEELEVAGPTLSMALTNALPSVASEEAHPRAVFGARRTSGSERSYGCFEVVFPEEGRRPTDGYAEWNIRASVTFEDAIEIFDASKEFDTAEGLLRCCAQELGDDEKSVQIIRDGVQRYLVAFDNIALWDPKASIDIENGLDDLFEDRDWTQFISRAELQVPEVSISNVALVPHKDAWLVRFDFVNGSDRGTEMEYVHQKKGRLYATRYGCSALRSAVPAFRGRQLPRVYDMLQEAIDLLFNGN